MIFVKSKEMKIDMTNGKNAALKILMRGALLLLIISCGEQSISPVGMYELEISGMKNASQGTLEIVGEPGDYFGKLTILASRKRVFEVGLLYLDLDSLAFILPGAGGFLRLGRHASLWRGKFKYFGLKAEISAVKTGEPSDEMSALVPLKPLGKGIISTLSEETFPCYDDRNGWLYFSRDNVLLVSKDLGEDRWGATDTLPFSGRYGDSAPFLAPDHNSLLFTSDRPQSGDRPGKKNLWLANRTSEGWEEPTRLPAPVNIDTIGDYHGSISADGDYYFISYNRTGGFGRSDIYQALEASEGIYEVIHLGPEINTENSEADVYIAPNGKFLLFASTKRDDSYGADDIYLSYRLEDGWSIPQNLGTKVNSFAYEYGARIDASGKHLYFNSYRRGTSDIYRIPVHEIEAFAGMNAELK